MAAPGGSNFPQVTKKVSQKGIPKPRPTRASLLLAQKKSSDLALAKRAQQRRPSQTSRRSQNLPKRAVPTRNPRDADIANLDTIEEEPSAFYPPNEVDKYLKQYNRAVDEMAGRQGRRTSIPGVKGKTPSATGLPRFKTGMPGPSAGPSRPKTPCVCPEPPPPSGGIPRPSTGIPRPSTGIPRPSTGIPRPSTGIPRPSTGIPRPPTGIPRPPGGIPRPAAGIPRPAAGIPRPAAGIPRPAAGIPRPKSKYTVDTAAFGGPFDTSADEFEAMERMIEAEMRQEGEDPRTRKRRLGQKSYDRGKQLYKDFASKMYDQQSALEDVYQPETIWEDDEAKAARKRHEKMTHEERMEELFPGMAFDEEEDLELDDELIPDSMIEAEETPTRTAKQRMEDLEKLHTGYYFTSPAYHSVMVTSPRPPVAPLRPTGPVKIDLPASPPHEEDLIQVPTSPSQVVGKFPPETFQFQYESPEKVKTPVRKPVPKIDMEGVTPPNKNWYFDLHDLHEKLRSPQTVPTVFDLPADAIEDEAPPYLARTPIDEEKFRKKILLGYTPKDAYFYKRKVGPPRIRREGREGGTLVQRHTEGPWFDMPYHLDERGKTPVKHYMVPYKFSPIKEGYETPEKKYPDVFDLPDMHQKFWIQSPPPGFASPVSPYNPPIDRWDLREEIQAGAAPPNPRRMQQTPKGNVPIYRRHKRPDLAAVPEELDVAEFEHSRRIKEAPGEWPKRVYEATGEWPQTVFSQMKVSELSPIKGSPRTPVEYPDTPTTRYPAGPSPEGRVGPRRMNIRKNLKKRRLDFSQQDPDELLVEAAEIKTNIGDSIQKETMPVVKDLPQFTPPGPTSYDYVKGLLPVPPEPDRFTPERPPEKHLTPSPGPAQTFEGSPRTPVQYLEQEEMPFVEDLPEFEPPSPMSQPGVLEKAIQDLKDHKYTKGRKPISNAERKLRHFYKRYFWKLLDKIPEAPLKEAVAKIHDQTEAQVDAEIAKKVAEEMAKKTLMDQPVPEELHKPIQPAVEVFGYETPPHLKPQPVQLKPLPYQREDAFTRKLFGDRGQDQDLDEFQRLEAAYALQDKPTAYPPGYIPLTPKSNVAVDAAQVQKAAEDQYQSLISPIKYPKLYYSKKPALTTEEMLASIARVAAEEAALEAAEKAAAEAAKAEAERERRRKIKEAKDAKLYRLMYGKKGPPSSKKAPPPGSGPAAAAPPKRAPAKAAVAVAAPPRGAAARPAPPRAAAARPAPPRAAAAGPAPPRGAAATPAPPRGATGVPAPPRGAAARPAPPRAATARPAPPRGATPRPGAPRPPQGAAPAGAPRPSQGAVPKAPCGPKTCAAPPVKPVRSDRSIGFKRSQDLLTPASSDPNVWRPGKKRQVVSKLDTGRKKKSQPEDELARKLGITPGDLQNITTRQNVARLEAEPVAGPSSQSSGPRRGSKTKSRPSRGGEIPKARGMFYEGEEYYDPYMQPLTRPCIPGLGASCTPPPPQASPLSAPPPLQDIIVLSAVPASSPLREEEEEAVMEASMIE